jgi:arsenate reductase
VTGDEAAVDAAFRATLAIIERRCKTFLGLPFQTLSRVELQRELDRIGSLLSRRTYVKAPAQS